MSHGTKWIDPRRIPIIGNDIYQVGQVYQIIDQTCTPNPVIAAKAAFAYAPTLIWMLLKPDALDLKYDRYTQRHRRKRYRKVRAKDLWFEGFKADTTARWAIWRAGQIAQRVGWYLIIADATTDWLINWTSLAYQLSGCNVPNPKWAYWRGDMAAPIHSSASPFQLYGPEHDKEGDAISSQTLLILRNTGPYTVTYSGIPLTFPDPGQSVVIEWIRIEIRFNNGPWEAFDADVSSILDGAYEKYDFAAENWITDGGTYEFRVIAKWTGGGLLMANQLLQAQGGASANLIADP